jgi:hypothetical protein
MNIKRVGGDYHKKPQNLRELVVYICKRNENGLIEFLENNKVNTGNSKKEIVEKTMLFLGRKQKQGKFKEAIRDLYKLHPDTEAIVEVFGLDKEPKKEVKEQTMSNFEGSTSTTATGITGKPVFRFSVAIVVILLLIIVISKIGD